MIQVFHVLPDEQVFITNARQCKVCGRPTKRRDDGVAICEEHGAVAFPVPVEAPDIQERQPEVLA